MESSFLDYWGRWVFPSVNLFLVTLFEIFAVPVSYFRYREKTQYFFAVILLPVICVHFYFWAAEMFIDFYVPVSFFAGLIFTASFVSNPFVGVGFGVFLIRHLDDFILEIADLYATADESEEWTKESWRTEQVELKRTYYEQNTKGLIRQWRRDKDRSFIWPSLLAQLLYDVSFSKTRRYFKLDVEEKVLRWMMITGSKRPE